MVDDLIVEAISAFDHFYGTATFAVLCRQKMMCLTRDTKIISLVLRKQSVQLAYQMRLLYKLSTQNYLGGGTAVPQSL